MKKFGLNSYCMPRPTLAFVLRWLGFGSSTTTAPVPLKRSLALACCAPTRASNENFSVTGSVATRSRFRPCSLMRPSSVPAGAVLALKLNSPRLK